MMRVFKAVFLGCFLLIVPVLVQAHQSLEVAGIVDGDTFGTEQKFMIEVNKIRLLGVDTPERNRAKADNCKLQQKNCWLVAKEYLQKMIGGKSIFCEFTGEDQYKRIIALCFLNEKQQKLGQSINALLVGEGLAVVDEYYLQTVRLRPLCEALLKKETQAFKEKRGIWRVNFPKEWGKRRQKKECKKK